MTPANFCYWLQGFFEVTENSDSKEIKLTEKQINVIRAHLNLVFFHAIDPETLKDKSDVEKLKYQKIHDGAKSGKPISQEEFDEMLIKKPTLSISKSQDEPKAFFYDDSRITFNC